MRHLSKVSQWCCCFAPKSKRRVAPKRKRNKGIRRSSPTRIKCFKVVYLLENHDELWCFALSYFKKICSFTIEIKLKPSGVPQAHEIDEKTPFLNLKKCCFKTVETESDAVATPIRPLFTPSKFTNSVFESENRWNYDETINENWWNMMKLGLSAKNLIYETRWNLMKHSVC